MKKRNLIAAMLLLGVCSLSAQQKPMMGWSSWNSYRVNINEQIIKAAADSLVSKGLAKVGYNYINIDDGWFGAENGVGRTADGVVKVHPTRFPNGMKVVADYIHSRGLKAGIYSDAGANTCGSIWDADSCGIGVGLWQHDQIDCNTFFKDWGYDYIKVDWCGGNLTGHTEEQRYTAIRQAMNETGRKALRLNICRWQFPGTWAMRVGGSWRISTDISPNWDAMVRQVEHNLYLAAYAGPGHFNDMDMCEIGNPKSTFTPAEERAHFGLWCIMKSPLLIGANLETITNDKVKLYSNTELIAINQDDLGEQAKVVWREGDLMVLASTIEKANGKVRAVALFNKSNKPARIRINFADLQLEGTAKVRDLWKHQDIGAFEEFYETEVEPHDAVMLRVVGKGRTDRTCYEGEYAFLNDYLPVNEATHARFKYHKSASGNCVATNLGGTSTNGAEFSVYVSKSGKYKLDIDYSCEDMRDMSLTVNNELYPIKALSSVTKEQIATKTLDITLRKGTNSIHIGNSIAAAPDIDCIRVERIGK